MDRTRRYEGLCAEGKPPLAVVPIGWQRRMHHSGVVYISPSGSVLACLEQVKGYLLTDGTCKCGLECPLIIHKIFNFDPGAAVKQRTAEDARADADVTKLCIHKRKIIAVATLHRSMESQHLQSGGTGPLPGVPLSHPAIRNNMHDGPPSSMALDSKNPYKMAGHGQRYHQHEMGSPPLRDPYGGYSRTRLGGNDHSSQRSSPYRSRHSVLLSPPSSSSASCGSQHYGDGTPSPRTETLGSPPDPSLLGFHGACSPGSVHMNGERFIPLSPSSILLHGSPSAAQPSCAMAGRTNVPLSPNINAKSPNMQKPPCSYPHNVDYQHKLQSACHPQPHLSMSQSQLPPCILQKKQVTTSEKDPLGILDPIPSKAPCHDPSLMPNPPGLQHNNAQSQVPSMNVSIPPPTTVPLPSNLPLPTAKSGLAGHAQRVHQQHLTPSSVSSSPIMSPVHNHMAGPGLARMEESPHRSRCSSTSSDHGGYGAHPAGLQGLSGGSKLSSRSPRPSMPPGTAYKLDTLHHHLKEAPNHLPGGMNSGLSRHPSSMCPPTSGSDGVLQRNHSVGMPLSPLLEQQSQNPSSFPASSLLSAAAKAQLVNQKTHTDSTGAVGAAEARGSTMGQPGLVGGGSQDRHGSTLNPRYLPNPGPPVSEAQSGRAALRDKLMAQQREALRKRKQPIDGSGNNDMSFSMLKHQLSGSGSGSSSSGYPEPLRRALQQGGGVMPPNTSMAQLLQSMSHHQSPHNGPMSHASAHNGLVSHQSAHNGLNHVGHHSPARSGKSPFMEEAVAQMSTLQGLEGPHQLQGRMEVPSYHNVNSEGQNAGQDLNSMEQFAGPMNHQMQDPAAFAGNFGLPLGYGGHGAMGSMGNPNPHQQQQQFGHYQKPPQVPGPPHFRGRAGLSAMVSNGGVHALSESGEVSSLSRDLRQAQEDSLQSLIRNSHPLQHQRQLRLQPEQQLGQGQGQGQPLPQGRHMFLGQGSHPDAPLPGGASSSPMNSLLQSFQVGFPERVSLPNGTMISRPGIMSPLDAICPQDPQLEYQTAHGHHGGGGGGGGGGAGAEVIDSIHQAAVGKASKITSMGDSGPFTSSVVGEPLNLSNGVSSVIHAPLHYPPEPEMEPRQRKPRVARSRKKTPERNNLSPAAMEAPSTTRFRTPRRSTQKRQWGGEAEGQEQQGLWYSDDLLHQRSQVLMGNGFSSSYAAAEMLKGPGHSGPQEHAPPPPTPPFQFSSLYPKSSLYAHMNGSRGPSAGRLHPRHAQAPAGSSSGPEGHFPKDYSLYNGHSNGHLNGHYNGHYNGHLNGHSSDVRGLSSEEDLRPADLSATSEVFHHRPRTHPHPGELLWGQGKGFPPWHGKMGNEGHIYPPGMLNSIQGKVEPEKFPRTLTEDLAARHKAKIHRNGGKMNNHLEAAIQEAMSELDKMTGNVHQMSQRDRPVKTPKPKRRKISR